MITEIAAGVYSIGQTGRYAYPSGYSHAYLLDDQETGLTLIDTLAEPSARLLLAALKTLGRPVTDLQRILITHGHLSHVGGLARIRALSGATVYSHEWEAPIIAGERPALPVYLRPLSPARLILMRLGAGFAASHTPAPVDRHLNDGDEVGSVRVIHTPGHTPGHLVFYLPDKAVLFTGDNVATWPTFSAGWPGFQLDDNEFRLSFRRMADSPRRMALLDPPIQALAVAHGEPITENADERLRSLVSSLDPSPAASSTPETAPAATHS